MSMIEVQYTSCPNSTDLVGKTRWINTDTGILYEDADGRYEVGRGYVGRATIGGVRRWGKENGTIVTQVISVDLPPSGYPDGNPKSVQGAKKYSLAYLPLPANIEVNRALEDGANKYGKANWRETGVAANVYVNAALRHIVQWYDGGQKNAEDSGVHNLGHAMACLAILIDAEAVGKLIDDRPTPCPNTDTLLKR